MNNETLRNLTKLRITGMLSEAAKLEVEEKIQQKKKAEPFEELDELNYS
jgi:hypothetical protein